MLKGTAFEVPWRVECRMQFRSPITNQPAFRESHQQASAAQKNNRAGLGRGRRGRQSAIQLKRRDRAVRIAIRIEIRQQTRRRVMLRKSADCNEKTPDIPNSRVAQIRTIGAPIARDEATCLNL